MASAVLKFGRIVKNRAFLLRVNARSRRQCLKNEFHKSAQCLASAEVLMPSLSPTMKEGTIVKWYKKEGDVINAGDVLCDIQTDKAIMALDTEEEGIMAKIIVPASSTDIKVGDLIAIVVEEGDDWQNVEIPEAGTTSSLEGVASSSPAPIVDKVEPSSGGASTQTVLTPGALEILMPSLSPTMKDGTIIRWLKKEGDVVNPGDCLCEIQTDKAVMSFDTEEEGILAKILKPDNSSGIEVGTLIGVMVEEGGDWQNVEVGVSYSPAPSTDSPAPSIDTPAGKAEPTMTSVTQTSPAALHSAGVGPSVRKLLEEYNINMADVTASGPHNKPNKGDVLKYIKERKLQKQAISAPAPPPTPGTTSPLVSASTTQHVQSIPEFDGEEYIDIPNTGMRTTIAQRLTLSKTTIPHSYATINCSVDPVTKLRKKLLAEGVKVSVNDFIIRSAALALTFVPQVNSVWTGDEHNSAPTVDVCVAVATENGLITPIVKNAASSRVADISAAVRDLAERARSNKLQLHEFQGGSFTISNLGMFGITEFSAVINPPQTAILAIGSSRLVPGPDGAPESQMTVTLSYDARVIEESQAFEYLDVFKSTMENPFS